MRRAVPPEVARTAEVEAVAGTPEVEAVAGAAEVEAVARTAAVVAAESVVGITEPTQFTEVTPAGVLLAATSSWVMSLPVWVVLARCRGTNRSPETRSWWGLEQELQPPPGV